MATVDLGKCSTEQRKIYKRMSAAGKGDAPRNIWSSAYRSNYDRINWSTKRNVKNDPNA